MAIKIVQSEPDPSVIMQRICLNCGVTIEYLPRDILKYKGELSIHCPHCGIEIIIKKAGYYWFLIGTILSICLVMVKSSLDIYTFSWWITVVPLILFSILEIIQYFWRKRNPYGSKNKPGERNGN